MKLRDWRNRAVERLVASGSDTPAQDVRSFIAYVLGVEPKWVTLMPDQALSQEQRTQLNKMVEARCAGKPRARILGEQHFWGRPFKISKDVLDPRAESETLIAVALDEGYERVLDLGTGSGILAITLLAERKEAKAWALDLSERALNIAQHNAESLGVVDRLQFMQSDWFAALTPDYQFDLILANPPYIGADEMDLLSPAVRDYDPHMALCPGQDALSAYRVIAQHAPQHLCLGGRLLLEVGATQSAEVGAICQEAGFDEVKIYSDLGNRPRVVAARLPSSQTVLGTSSA